MLLGVGFSVIDDTPAELMYISLSAVDVRYVSNAREDTVEIKLGRLQIDNQLYNTPLPIVFRADIPYTPCDKASDEPPAPFIHISIVKSNLPVHLFCFAFFFLNFLPPCLLNLVSIYLSVSTFLAFTTAGTSRH